MTLKELFEKELISEKKLTYKEKHALPPSEFVFPDEERYPIEDLKHARNALARVHANGTEEEIKKVEKAVYKKYPGLKNRKAKREGKKKESKE